MKSEVFMMKHLLGWMAGILLLCLVAGCDKEEPGPAGRLSFTKSYFIGWMNDSLVDMRQNSIHDYRIEPRSSGFTDDGVEYIRWLVHFAADYHDESAGTLAFEWGGLHTGYFEITSSREYDADAKVVSNACLFKDGKRYVCSPEHPFKLYIGDIQPNPHSSFEIISGCMEGTFCNEENPTDRIVLRDVRFRLWH